MWCCVCVLRAQSVSVYKIVCVDIDNSAQRQAMPVLMENVWKCGNAALVSKRANGSICRVSVVSQQNTIFFVCVLERASE